MTTEAEDRVRDLLRAAAPEPRRILDGAAIRAAARDDDVIDTADRVHGSTGSKRWWTVGSAALVAAAVVVVAVIAVGSSSDRPGHHPSVAPAARPSHTASSAAGPSVCPTDALVIGLDGPTRRGADRVETVSIRDRSARSCRLDPLYELSLVQDGTTVSTLSTARYAPKRPVVIGPHSPALFDVVVYRAQNCDSGGGLQLTLASDGMSYGFPLSIRGCGWAIRSASVRTG